MTTAVHNLPNRHRFLPFTSSNISPLHNATIHMSTLSFTFAGPIFVDVLKTSDVSLAPVLFTPVTNASNFSRRYLLLVASAESTSSMDPQSYSLPALSIHTAVNSNSACREEHDLPTLSPAVLAFLSDEDEDVDELLRKPVVVVPPLVDDLPLKQYFISTSHNTYLLAWQFLGRASAEAYTHVLQENARCIEIDAWWSSMHNMPVVTHGHTLSQSVPFIDVCTAIGNAVPSRTDDFDSDLASDGMNEWPVFVSLECHVPVEHQDELVRIMDECWGDKLVRGEIEGIGGEDVTPRDLFGRIVLMVEYYPGEDLDEFQEEQVTDESNEDEPIVHDGEDHGIELDTMNKDSKISESLAQLGFYARSMKPPGGWYCEVFESPPHPPNVLLNVGEPQMKSLIPKALTDLVQSGSQHLRRVYPSGLRLSSTNLDPLRQWRSGTHMACLNWQHYDEGRQLNEALFVGSKGWVAKPDLEGIGSEQRKQMRLTGRIVGLSSLPRAADGHDFVGYCRAELFLDGGKQEWKSGQVHSEKIPQDSVNIMWDEVFTLEFESDELAFFRLKVIRRHDMLRDEELAVFCVRLSQLVPGLSLVRLLDMHGKYTGATLLCDFTLECTESNEDP